MTKAAFDKINAGLKDAEAIIAKGATAPRVSLADMEGKIVATHFFSAGRALELLSRDGQPFHIEPSLHSLTICILVMKNGFTIIGKSAPASPENFDADKGERLAYEDAIKQLWPLEGYALRERLAAT